MRIRRDFRQWIARHERLDRTFRFLGRHRRKLTGGFVLVAHLLGALTSVKAIMETRTSQGAIAWAISLNTMPYVAVPAYWVFGRSDFNGYVTARRTERSRFREFWDDFETRLRDQDLVTEPDREGPFVTEQLARLPATGGNDAELLVDGDEYKGLDPDVGYWRDTHMRVEGPIVQSVQVSFAEDWYWAAKEILDELNWDPKPAANGENKRMLCLPSGPVDPLETCTLFFLHAINEAEERLWIASPYFVPDPQFISALQLASLRGVEVRILIPDEGDSTMVDLSAWSFLPELHDAGVEVYRYQKGFMHHKVTVIDDRYCTIGTANFDNRSFRLNFEVTMGVDDEAFTSEVADMLAEDFANSRKVAKGEFESKSAWFRFWSRVSRLAAPIQ